MPISCMKGMWAVPMLIGLAAIILVIIAAFPVLLIPLAIWRLWLAWKPA